MFLAKHLTKTDVQAVLGTINSWKEGALTWDAICDAVEPFVGKRPTRQSLSSIALVKLAYSKRKQAIGKELVKSPSPSSMSIAQARLEKLDAQNKLLAARNQQLLEQFVVWQYNATQFGMTVHQLNAALPRIDRERSHPKSAAKKRKYGQDL